MKPATWIRSHTELWARWPERRFSPAVIFPPASAESGEARALSSPTARAAIVACTLGAMFPDIDIFAGPLAHNPLAIMEWHRNITHSAVMLPIWALLLAAVSIPLARLVKWKSPPFLNALRNLRGGNRHAHFSRSGHQFRNDGLEPAALFAPGLGLDFHSRSDADRDCPRAAVCRVVLPRTGTILAPRHWRLGRAHRRSIRSVSVCEHRRDTDFRSRLRVW